MPDIVKELNLNKHPKNCNNLSLVYAKNVRVSNDGSCLQNEESILSHQVISSALENKVIVGYIPCNKEIIFVVTDREFRNNDSEINASLYRYDELSNTIKEVYSNYKYHGGNITGTFTYNIKSHLILAISEYDCPNGEYVPLRTIDLGLFEGGYREDTDLDLDYESLSFNPFVKISELVSHNIINGSGYKGYYYFFIRYKINNNDYTKWYSLGYPILLDDISEVTLFDYNINRRPVDGNDTTLDYTTISDYISSVGDICNKTLKLNINHYLNDGQNSDLKYYQIGFICTSTSYSKAFKTLDKPINGNNEFILDYTSVEEYSVNDLIQNRINYYNVKNAINSKNKLYIANYKEQGANDDYDRLQINANSVILSCIENKKSFSTAAKKYYEPVVHTSDIQTIIIDLQNKTNADSSYASGNPLFFASDKFLEGNSFTQEIRASSNLDITGSNVTIFKPQIIVDRGNVYNNYTLDEIYVSNSFRNNGTNIYPKEVSCIIDIPQENLYGILKFKILSAGQHSYKYYNIEYKVSEGTFDSYSSPNNNVEYLEFDTYNIKNSFKDNIINSYLIPNGYYKFYVHYVDNYGESTDGIPIKYVGGNHIGFDNISGYNDSQIQDEYIFHIPKDIYDNEGNLVYYSLGINFDELDRNLNSKYKGFFLSYEYYKDINDYIGVLLKYDFNKTYPGSITGDFVNYSSQGATELNNINYRFYCLDLDIERLKNFKSDKLELLISNCFDVFSNTYASNKLKDYKGVYIDKNSLNVLDNYTYVNKKYVISGIKFVPAHSFISENDYRGSYLEISISNPDDTLVQASKVGCICRLLSNDSNLYSQEHKTLIKFTNVIYFTPDRDKTIIYGLNGHITFNRALVYNNDKVIFNEGFNVLLNSKYFAYTGSTSFNEDEINPKKIANQNNIPFIVYYNFPIISDIVYETRRFNTLPEIIFTRSEKINNNSGNQIFQFAQGTIVQPMNTLDLFNLPILNQDNFNPLTYTNYIKYYVSEFDKRIARSNVISDESFENRWRIFNLNDYKDISENKGNITNLVSIGDTFLVHTEHSLFMFSTDAVLKTNTGQDVNVSPADIYETDYKEVFSSALGTCGLQDKKASIYDEFGYIFYDNDNHQFYRFGSQQVEILDANINQFLFKYRPYEVRFANDKNGNRLLIDIKYYDRGYQEIVLSYSYLVNKFISFHTYNFDEASTTKNNIYLFKNFKKANSKVYYINKDWKTGNRDSQNITNNEYLSNVAYNNFENNFIDDSQLEDILKNNKSQVDILINDSYEVIKYLEFIVYKLYEVLSDTIDNNLSYPVEEIIPNAGLAIRVYNMGHMKDKVDTGYINVTRANLDNLDVSQNPMEYKLPYWHNGNWNFNYLRDIIKGGDSRLWGNYFVVSIIFASNINRLELETLNYNVVKQERI